METSALSSHSHPHLTSHDDLDWKYSSFKPDTTLLPSSGLLSSSADLLSGSHLAAWMNSNSKPDTRAGNPSSSGCRRKVSKSQLHSHALSNCLLTSDDRNSNSDTFSTHGKAEDLLSTLDWGKGEVEDNVHSIVQALMKKTVRGRKGERGGRRRGHHDPRVTMEMRHKQVQSVQLWWSWICCRRALCSSYISQQTNPPLSVSVARPSQKRNMFMYCIYNVHVYAENITG